MDKQYPAGRVVYNKLIRDKVPEVMRAKGVTFATDVIVDDAQFVAQLRQKLQEEAAEAATADGREDALRELADVEAVIDGLLLALGVTREEFLEICQAQKEKKGGFASRLLLLWSEH